MSAKILVGTASWTDPTLLRCKRFYPPEAKNAEARLRYYAEHFSIVEVDSSYYALPSEQNAQLWVERTPPGFLFNLKVFRFFTQHQTPLEVLPRNVLAGLGGTGEGNLYYADAPAEVRDELWRQFRLALEPLVCGGKLGALLFQFPKWFIARRASIEHLHEVRERLAGYRIAVEFRHESWFAERQRTSTLALERELGFCNVVVDEPQNVPGSIPPVWETTLPELAMFRLHGRNAATWNLKGLRAASERFNYDYAEPELASFVAPVLELAGAAQQVHVILNNNLEDQGVRNARTFIELLSRARQSDALQSSNGCKE